MIIVEGLRREDWAEGGGRCATLNGQGRKGTRAPCTKYLPSCSYLWYGERAANRGQKARMPEEGWEPLAKSQMVGEGAGLEWAWKREQLPFQAGHEGGQPGGPQPRVPRTYPGLVPAASRLQPGLPAGADDVGPRPHAYLEKGGVDATCEQ